MGGLISFTFRCAKTSTFKYNIKFGNRWITHNRLTAQLVSILVELTFVSAKLKTNQIFFQNFMNERVKLY